MHLDEWLKANEIRQGEFARRVGVSDAYLSRIIRGERSPSSGLALRIEEETNRSVLLGDLLSKTAQEQQGAA